MRFMLFMPIALSVKPPPVLSKKRTQN
jgi:hypothetical protein